MQAAGLRQPGFQRLPVEEGPEAAADAVRYPCVLKPLFLNASRGVLRADTPEAFRAAFHRIAALIADPTLQAQGGDAARWILVEDYLPGEEVALEGMIVDGRFRLLAFFDKPDPLEGPIFEETLFITPSRHPEPMQRACVDVVDRAVAAMGLRTGPVHAELRITEGEPWVVELATRSIGGHCSRALTFGTGMSLEEMILRHALQLPVTDWGREQAASGVMMLPVPRAGVLHDVTGLEEARAVPHITDVEITIARNQPVVPLPEGNRYLGFLFARADTPGEVEASLRAAYSQLGIDIRDDA